MNHKIVYGGKQSTKHGVLAVWFMTIYHGEIHMSEKQYNYVYQITNIITGRKYIGKRSSSIAPENDIGKKYFSSSIDRDFITEQKISPQNFKYEVLAEFATSTDAVAYEVELHAKYNIGVNSDFYNRAKQTSKFFDFSPTGKVSVRDKDGNHLLVDKTDARYVSGELISSSIGKIVVKDDKGNFYSIDKNDPRYLSGELIHVTKGRPMDDYTRSRVKESQTGAENVNYGKMWIYNPTEHKNLSIKKTDPIPEGWIQGRRIKQKSTICKLCKHCSTEFEVKNKEKFCSDKCKESAREVTKQQQKYKNGFSVSVDGVYYDSISHAADTLNIGHETARCRFKSKNFPNYIIIQK